MKALSCWPVWAALIAAGEKTLEIRSRPTKHRGELLICSSKRPGYGTVPRGAALCIVNIIGCRPMTPEDEPAAGCACQPGLWAWELSRVRAIEPFPVTGRLGFFDVDIPPATRLMPRRQRLELLSA